MKKHAPRLMAFCGCLAACAGWGNASILLSMSFDDLSGAFNGFARSGTFTAVAVNSELLASSYELARIDGGGGVAGFEAGFVSNPFNRADVQLQISVAPGPDLTSASGSGVVVATDADGDTFEASIAGTWIYGSSGLVFFNGTLSDVRLIDNGVSDGRFDGTESGSVRTDDLCGQPYSGTVVQLSFGAVNFFSAPFRDRATGGTFQVLESGAPRCAADFNLDGGVDGTDVDAFFDSWSNGRPCADVNGDGGIDGADVQAFFSQWESGGC